LLDLPAAFPIDRDPQSPELREIWEAGRLASRCLQPDAFLQYRFHLGIPTKPNAESGMIPNGIPG
jgi:hypothetical protein